MRSNFWVALTLTVSAMVAWIAWAGGSSGAAVPSTLSSTARGASASAPGVTTTTRSADAIQGVYVWKTVIFGRDASAIWVFYADGKIIQYGLLDRTTVHLSDASYRIGKQIDATRYQMTLNTGGDGPKGTGVMSLILDPTSKEYNGFTFSAEVDGGVAQFLGSKASELKSLLKDVTGTLDFREDKKADWRAIDADLPNVFGRTVEQDKSTQPSTTLPSRP